MLKVSIRCLELVLGYAYPAFKCYKTVERNGVQIEELRLWCQYWIIVAVFTILEMIGDIFISWFPMYGWLKLALFISTTQASSYVYGIVLGPLLAEYEADIDEELQRWRANCPQLVACLSVLPNFNLDVLSAWFTNPNRVNEQRRLRRNQPLVQMRCANNNCDLYGNPATMNLCSVCYRRRRRE